MFLGKYLLTIYQLFFDWFLLQKSLNKLNVFGRADFKGIHPANFEFRDCLWF
jgi:hypothetical protein